MWRNLAALSLVVGEQRVIVCVLVEHWGCRAIGVVVIVRPPLICVSACVANVLAPVLLLHNTAAQDAQEEWDPDDPWEEEGDMEE